MKLRPECRSVFDAEQWPFLVSRRGSAVQYVVRGAAPRHTWEPGWVFGSTTTSGRHDEYTERLLREPRAILGDRTWNGTTTPDGVTTFYTRLDTIRDPPGFVGYQAPTRVDDGQPSHHYAFDKRWRE